MSLPQPAAAALMGVAPRTLRDWDASGKGPPRNSDGTYPGPGLVAWRIAKETGADLDASRERARKDKEWADKLAIGNQASRGEYLPRDPTLGSVAVAYGIVQSGVVQLPDEIGQICPPGIAPAIVAESRIRCHQMLADCAARLRELARAATDADSESVGGSEPSDVEGVERDGGPVED